MTISKNASRVLKVTDFEMTACPPNSTLKMNVLMLKLKRILPNTIQDYRLKFLMVSFKAFNFMIQESYDFKRVEHDL
jgi:hypothetical protein